MKSRSFVVIAVALLMALSYSVGKGSQWLSAQGRTGPQDRPVRPPAANPGSGTATATGAGPEVLVYGDDSGSAVSANGILAVTGSYGVGTSVLYVIDTESRQLAVYEARGGSQSMRRLTLVGARRIDLDLQLVSYNDESEWSYSELERRFDSTTSALPDVPEGESGDVKDR